MSSLACRVCLRTNVKTLDLPVQLRTFYDELCNFETVQHKRLKYCALCAHQIKKCYKFKGQCLRANGLLKLWIKHENKDISEYHKELPSPSLQFTNNSTSFLFECDHDEKTLHNTNVTSDSKRNMLLKLNKSSLAPDDRMKPESSDHCLYSKPSVPNRPNPDLRLAIRPSPGPTPALRPNDGLRPSLRPKIFIRRDLRSILKTEHVKGESGMLTIGPSLLSAQTRPYFRPNLGPTPALRPNDGLRPRFRPKIVKRSDLRSILKTEHVKGENGMLTIGPSHLSVQSSAFRPNISLKPALKRNSGYGLSIQLVPTTVPASVHNQPKQTDLTLDPDFDVSYETDPLSVVKDENAMGIDENTMDIVKGESLLEIEKQDVYMDDNTIGIDDAIGSVVEIEQKEVDNNECTIDSPLPEEYLIINDNDTDSYEYLEQDIDWLDYATKPKQEETSESTNLEDVSDKNVLQPAQNETNPYISLEAEDKRITRKYAENAKVKLYPEHKYRSRGFKAVPNCQDKILRLLDESPFVLDDDTVLKKELFSVIYDKFTARELRRLARILLTDDFRVKLTAYLGVLHRKYNPEYESVFDVEYLRTEEKRHEEFKRRELHPDYISAAYKCELCYETFSGQGFLDYHKKIHHNPANPLICSICSCSMPTPARLIRHRRLAHQTAYSCKLCQLRTNQVNVMRNHYDSHKGAQYQCPICSKACYNAHTLRKHKRRAHATHVCTTCAEQYTTEKGLRVHRETQHKDAPPVEPADSVPCAACDITFDTRKSYLRHCNVTHSFPRENNARSRSPVSTTPKVKTRKNKRVYRTCEICHEKVYVEKFAGFLYRHFKEKHPGVPYHAKGMLAKDFLCDECGKAFACHATLLDHKNRHTGLRPHMCELCPARFHTKVQRWAHRVQKHCERSLRCKECGKLFKTPSHLLAHMKIHIGVRRFKCEICGKDFLHNSGLKEHVKGVHYKERRVKKAKKPAQEI